MLGPKMAHLLHFGRNKNFSQQKGSATFQCSLNRKPHAKNQCEKGATGGNTWAELIGPFGKAYSQLTKPTMLILILIKR